MVIKIITEDTIDNNKATNNHSNRENHRGHIGRDNSRERIVRRDPDRSRERTDLNPREHNNNNSNKMDNRNHVTNNNSIYLI